MLIVLHGNPNLLPMKLIYFNGGPEEKAMLHKALPDVTVEVVEDQLNSETIQLARDAQIISAYVFAPIDTKALAQMPELEMIATRSAGHDHIDLATCRQRGIVVSNVPNYGERTVAEHTFALILALSRRMVPSLQRTEKMNFDRAGLTGFDLSGKTLGVIGMGNIGKNVARIGHCFEMRILAYDQVHDDDFATAHGVTYVTAVEELLERSDIITLHLPYTKATHHTINRDNVTKVKRGALLINTARGGLVDTQALLWGLNEGLISGAGLDVLEEEKDAFDRIEFMSRKSPSYEELATLLRNHLLVARDDVLITPHNAFNSTEAVQRIFDTTVLNIQAYLASNPINEVTTTAARNT